MNIGIDFDNTIASYDSLFQQIAKVKRLVPKNWNGSSKMEVRDYLRQQLDGEKTWMKLQGVIYGEYMHRAEMMPGMANFFVSCNIRKYSIFIVSHKTEYGHYDPGKISLRQEALKWMENKHFFSLEHFGINKNDVFFADTREEKVKKISELKCDWFIDDLPEIFEEPLFPFETKKMLIGPYKPELFHNTTVLNSWRKISEKILGQITDQDVISWSKQLVDEPIKHMEKIPGRGNSSVYKVIVSSKKCYALKYYPDQISDKRPRLGTEFNSLRLLHQHNIINVPKAVEKNDDLSLGLYEWINGENVTKPSVDDLDQTIDFVKKMYSLSHRINKNDIALASEACLSCRDLIDQIENRLFTLVSESKYFPELSTFLEGTYEPLWTELKDESISLWPLESRDESLPKNKQILSSSDFGFHNSLKLDDGVLTFIDFDYFGWDDPVKLIADFLWHPAMKLNNNLIERWKEAMLELFNTDKCFENRFNAAMPLYGLRWALIILNEFLPGFTDKRKKAGETETYNVDKIREIQLKKAKHYCDKVKTMISQISFV